MSRRIAVCGGGLAGLTAALRCADAGADVVLLEASPRLGGLTCSFQRGELCIDNGQHVFLRCCHRYRALLERLGVSDLVTVQPRLDVPVVTAGSRAHRLRRSGLPAPLHLAGALLGYQALTPRQRLSALRVAAALRRVDPTAPASDALTFGRWLADRGQDQQTVEALWDLVGVATLNARAEEASLSLAAVVFQLGLLTDRAAGDLGWSTVPLQRLHAEPAARALAVAGATVRTGARVTAVEPAGAGWHVRVRDGAPVEVDHVVLALPPRQTEQLLPRGALDLTAGWSGGLGAAPIVNVHVVYDRQVLDEPFVAALGSPVQWVFDRTSQVGLNSGQCLAVSLSAADGLIDQPVSDLRALIVPALADLLPLARGAVVREVFVTREREATFRPRPGTAALRPGPATNRFGLVISGAWTDTGWPATMEGAVRSGEAAAAVALADPVLVPSGHRDDEEAA